MQSYPPPSNERLGATSALVKSAEADKSADPQVQTLRQSARRSYEEATQAMASGDNGRANFALSQAEADAELAVALAKSQHARTEADEAVASLESYRAQATGPTGTPAAPTNGPTPTAPTTLPQHE